MALDVGDIVKIIWHPGEDTVRDRNGQIKPLRLMYDNRTYDIAPEQDAFIPFECAVLWFGDPRASSSVSSYTAASGVRGWIADRETEVRRLRTKYGVFAGPEDEIPGSPNVEMFSLEGERVYTVLDDPLGEGVVTQAPTLAEAANQQQRIDNLEKLVHALLAGGAQNIAGATPENSQTGEPPAPPEPPESEPPSEQGTLDDDVDEEPSGTGQPPMDEFSHDPATAPTPIPTTNNIPPPPTDQPLDASNGSNAPDSFVDLTEPGTTDTPPA